MMTTNRKALVMLSCIVFIIIGSGAAAPANLPWAQATATPPPVVIATSPEQGGEQPVDAPLEITFDRPMDRDSVERAFAIEPGASADGTFEWTDDDRTLRFQFNDGFQPGRRYKVRLVETAQSQAGESLQRPFELSFSTPGSLQVTGVQPPAGATEVPLQAPVTIFFDRPVVPLAAATTRPDPLTFVPPVTGQGQWLNTATYRFTPAEPGFDPATEYTARVSSGLAAAVGQASLEEDFTWTFTTISPAAVASIPTEGDIHVSPTPVISVAFNQLMDHQSVENSLSLREETDGQEIPGQFAWAETGLLPPTPEPPPGPPEAAPTEPEPVGVETVTFTPAEPLQLGATYRLILSKGAASAQGVKTKDEYRATFTVAPAPAVVNTIPADGEQFAEIWPPLDITFNAPIDPHSVVVGQSLVITPQVAPTDVYTYWSNNHTLLSLNFPRAENSAYTVTLGADIESRYGQTLDQPTTVHWKTLRKTPYVHLVSPKIATYNGYQEQTYVYMTVRNVNQVNFELYRLSMEEFLPLGHRSFQGWDQPMEWDQFQPGSEALVAEWQQSADPESFVNHVYKVDVSQPVAQDEPLPPGLYYLKAFARAENFYAEAQESDPSMARDSQILIVSKHNLTVKQGEGDVLAWLTDLKSGQPLADIPLLFIDPAGQAKKATSDAEGTAQFTYTPASDSQGQKVFVFAGQVDPPGDDFTVGTNGWQAGINPFDFDYLYGPDGFGYTGRYAGAVYTDRPLYRPGQTVYFKGIIRADDDADYSIPATSETAQVIIRDALYKEIYNQDLPLNEWGTFNGSLVLDQEASLGSYQVEVRYNELDEYSTTANDSFQVAEYRKPEFSVQASTGKSEYVSGETIDLNLQTEFFFGGPVADAAVRWTLLSDPYYFDYQGREYYDFTNEATSRSREFNPAYGYGFGEEIANGTGTTDAQGRFSLSVPADISNRLTSQTFTFDIAVTGLNNQAVATQARVVVHKGRLYVGLRPEQYVGQIGEPNRVNLLVVDWDSQPVADQAVEVVFARQEWYSSQQLDPEASRYSPDDQFYWENIVQNVALYTATVTTDQDGQASASFTPEQGGTYKIYAHTIDEAGHRLYASVFTWVSGYEYVNWGQENNDRIELIADKRQYNTGDVATLLIPHPYSGTVTALVTLERGHIYQHYVTQLETNSDRIEIPITDQMSPNIYVSAIIIKGMAADGSDLPGFKMGYARLNVNQQEKALQISLSADKEEYRPGQVAQYQVQVTDYRGQPVQAELSLALIDKALLALAPEPGGQLLGDFWHQRYLNIQTGSGLTLALDRINRALDEKKGGGGGAEAPGAESVRRNFADTALWIADFETDENGRGSFEAPLPDNLTTWVLIGRGVTGAETLVGEGRAEITTAKPLLVRPVAPRFLVVGDRLTLGLIVQNQGQEEMAVRAELAADGLQVDRWRLAGQPWQSLAERAEVTVPAGERVKVEYRATAELAAQASLTMSAVSGQHSDAVALVLPIHRLATPETAATIGLLAPDEESRLEGIALPPGYMPQQGHLALHIEPSLAAGLHNGLDYLVHFPYECVEQTVSRFLPNILTYRTYRQLGLDRPAGAEELSRQVSMGLQRLNSQQHMDGGWGWWPGDPSDPYLTAYVLLGLVEARRADLAVEQWVIDSTVEYLQQNLAVPKDITEPWQANRQAFILYALAEAGHSDLSRSMTLYERREQLHLFGQAYLALAMYQADKEAPQVETLLNNLAQAAIVSATGAHWEEEQVDFHAMNSDTRTTAIVLATMARIQPDNPMLPQAVRWLMSNRRQDGHWTTTQETAWAIIGLTDWLLASGELGADYTWQVNLNGQPLGQGTVDQANLDRVTTLQVEIADLLTDQVNHLAIERDGQAGRLYYGAYLTYYRPVEQVKALDRGIVLSRRYTIEPGQAITQAQVGDFIQVHLTLIAPTDLHYVVVEDYLPAGTEALDSSLQTTSLEALRQTGGSPDNEPWGWWYFTHTDLRDEKAVLFATYLPQGVYEYTYTIRASIPGQYHVIPTHAEQMYFPEVFGRSDGGLLTIQ